MQVILIVSTCEIVLSSCNCSMLFTAQLHVGIVILQLG